MTKAHQRKVCKPETDSEQWRFLDWKTIDKKVYKLQTRIYKATKRGDIAIVRKLQKILTASWSARCLAVRKVTQENKGKKTAGIDGIKDLSQSNRIKLARNLKLRGKSKSVRRVWIPKPGKKEKRPLGIPTIEDRALQTLAKMALEPEWEAKFEPRSYGFRPGRSVHDAVEAIFKSISKNQRFVLDTDIESCFDKINHSKLLAKVETYPKLRRQIKAWLKAGIMDNGHLFPTKEGVPQGGSLSPLLANIALHGMDKLLRTAFPKMGKGHRATWYHKKGEQFNSPILVRYADDLVVLHNNVEVIKASKKLINEWLGQLGLRLKESKTKIVHTFHEHESNRPGFDFLGFNFRQFEAGQYSSGRTSKGDLLGFKAIIKPSKEALKRHHYKLRNIVRQLRTSKQEVLISRLNSVIKGWTIYYSTVCSKDSFETQDHLLFSSLVRWARRRHPRIKSWCNVKDKYWKKSKTENWIFTHKDIDDRLIRHNQTPIKRHVMVRGDASPYDGNLIYWSTRMGRSPKLTPQKATLLKEQKGRCNWCGLLFREGDHLEEDHVVAQHKGGKTVLSNLQLLHRQCHQRKSRIDFQEWYECQSPLD